MRPVSLADYQFLRAAVTIAADSLLNEDIPELLTEMVGFLRGHCVRCAEKLPKAETYMSVCWHCGTIQPWVWN